MTFQQLVADIQAEAGQRLRELGLTVFPITAKFPGAEDHGIEFRDEVGRSHAVNVNVSSQYPTLDNATIAIEHVSLQPVEGTRFSCVKSGWSYQGLPFGSPSKKIDHILTVIREHNRFVPNDDLEAGIVKDFRWASVIPAMRKQFFDGEVRMGRSKPGGPYDFVEILHGNEVSAKAAFDGGATIRVTYETICGDDRVLEYNGLVRFNENLGRDIGGIVPSETHGPRP